jgi:hypothetical protein
MFFSDNVPVYLFIHLKGQLMQFALRNEIQEKISAKTVSSKLLVSSKTVCNVNFVTIVLYQLTMSLYNKLQAFLKFEKTGQWEMKHVTLYIQEIKQFHNFFSLTCVCTARYWLYATAFTSSLVWDG